MHFRHLALTIVAALTVATAAQAQPGGLEPFATPIQADEGVITVSYREFASIPYAGTEPPRMTLLLDEPGTRRAFVNTMQGALYSVSYDGKTVTPYLDINAQSWGLPVEARGNERGFQSFAFHPQFAERGAPGYGKFYTYLDTSDMAPKGDFVPGGEGHTHDTVLLEWTAKDASATTYDGAKPRELFRVVQPFQNHNCGQIGFNPLARPGTPEFGLLYIGVADGGSGGDPFNHAQNLASAFGKILRIDPLGRNSRNGKYGNPESNPYAGDGKDNTLDEIFAFGVRNPQRFTWDAKTGTMYVADIGQNMVEEVSPVTRGANLGWNKWEGSYRYADRQIQLANPRSEAGMTWPVVEFDHRDPLFQRTAITGLYVYRESAIRQLAHLMIFGDNPSGELFYVDADHLPNGGQSAIRRILFNDKGTRKTLLQLIREKNAADGQESAPRADLRMGLGPQNQIFILNKRDGVIRLLVPDNANSSR